MSRTRIDLQGQPYTDYSAYGIEINDYSRGGSIRLLARKGEGFDSRTPMYFSGTTARQLGLRLLEVAGVETTDVDSLTRASDISFNEGIIRVAAVHGRTVKFRYAKTDTAPIEYRTVMPSEVENHGNTVLFIGEDPDRGGYRSFRLDRIKGNVEVES